MAIYYSEDTRTFYLEGKSTTYAFFINQRGYAEHLYFGERIGRDDLRYSRTAGGISGIATVPGDDSALENSYHLFRPEISFYGTGDFREATVHPENAEGDRLTELLYHSHEILTEKPPIDGMPSSRGGETLVIRLYDKLTDFYADLYYTVYDDSDIIARRAVYRNLRKSPVKLTRAYSFALSLPERKYDILSLYGAWAQERHIERYKMHHGVASIDSKRTASSATLNPFMALMDEGADEEHGSVYGFSLVYSSSFVLKCEGTNDGQTLVTGGINDFDFSWTLDEGCELATPEVLIAYSNEGLGGMSREYHDFLRSYIIPERFARNPRPIVINNWEGTYFDFDTEKLKSIATAVKDTGIDTFVLDDGWFGNRNSDRTGLGDWYVNEKKLEGGLDAIIEHVNSLGMDFGLWFEPEMISIDSDIYRAHPEYAIAAEGRTPCLSRHQLCMDLTNPEVRDYIVNSVNNILHNHNIKYVKWDYNRRVTESVSPSIPKGRQSEFAHRYALGLYDILDRIVNANPDIFFEGCAGGGARFDPGVLAYFPQIWTSDDTDAYERTRIQYGTSIVYPLSSMSAHVSAVPNHQTKRVTPMRSRVDIAHLGATGYELDPTVFTDSDRERVAGETREYRETESLLLEGDLYRTESPFDGNYFGFMLVSKDKSIAKATLFRSMATVTYASGIKRFKFPGLDRAKKYLIPELGLKVTGTTVKNVGIPEMFKEGDHMTVTLTFREINE